MMPNSGVPTTPYPRWFVESRRRDDLRSHRDREPSVVSPLHEDAVSQHALLLKNSNTPHPYAGQQERVLRAIENADPSNQTQCFEAYLTAASVIGLPERPMYRALACEYVDHRNPVQLASLHKAAATIPSSLARIFSVAPRSNAQRFHSHCSALFEPGINPHTHFCHVENAFRFASDKQQRLQVMLEAQNHTSDSMAKEWYVYQGLRHKDSYSFPPLGVRSYSAEDIEYDIRQANDSHQFFQIMLQAAKETIDVGARQMYTSRALHYAKSPDERYSANLLANHVFQEAKSAGYLYVAFQCAPDYLQRHLLSLLHIENGASGIYDRFFAMVLRHSRHRRYLDDSQESASQVAVPTR